jgi:hypothetical protein
MNRADGLVLLAALAQTFIEFRLEKAPSQSADRVAGTSVASCAREC